VQAACSVGGSWSCRPTPRPVDGENNPRIRPFKNRPGDDVDGWSGRIKLMRESGRPRLAFLGTLSTGWPSRGVPVPSGRSFLLTTDGRQVVGTRVYSTSVEFGTSAGSCRGSGATIAQIDATVGFPIHI
jgi:hypothetical protein